MTLSIDLPYTYQKERIYVAETIFHQFLGIDIFISFTERIDSKISYGNKGRHLLISDGLFAVPPKDWLGASSLPKQPLSIWKLDGTKELASLNYEGVPVIYGQRKENNSFLKVFDQQILLGLDIFGSIFFMLTRYEEIIEKKRDKFQRFPASASLAYKEGFLHRPIVNEYVEIFWRCLKLLWPGLTRQPRQFRVRVSHDVDHPFQYAFIRPSTLLRNAIGDVSKRGSLSQGLSRIRLWNHVQRGHISEDPFNTFDWIMDISEKHNLTSAFYFIAEHTDPQKDGDYTIDHPLLRGLIRKIHQRGHEIGLHTSFNTYLDPVQTRREFEKLLKICKEEKISQQTWGGRQHFLRWQTPYTFQNLDSAGLTYDSTLTFAEQAGFRCGVCYEYPVFNLLTRQKLKILERPLVVMECTVLDDRYMGLNYDTQKAYDYIAGLKNACRLFNGDFTLLWHNNRFVKPEEKELYQQVIVA